MRFWIIIALFTENPLIHSSYSNELHIIYSAFDINNENKLKIELGFFRGEFLSFSLGALLLGILPINEKPDYEVNPVWSGNYPVENTTYIFGDSGYIKIENDILYTQLQTKNYSLSATHYIESECALSFPSSNAENAIFIPNLRSEGRLKMQGFEILLKGYSFYWGLWGNRRLKLNDHAVFCVENECVFLEFDIKKKMAKISFCPQKKEIENEFSIINLSKGSATGRTYPANIEIGKGKIKINVDSMKNEAKLLTFSYLISSITVEKDSKTGTGFIFFHPVEEKKKWEF